VTKATDLDAYAKPLGPGRIRSTTGAASTRTGPAASSAWPAGRGMGTLS